MVARVQTVAFHGVEVLDVETQVTIARRPAGFQRRRLAGQGGRRKARAGARRAWCARPRVAAAPHHGQSRARRRVEGGQPFRPADRARPARGDGGLPADELAGYTALGELALDGSLTRVAGVLLAALAAAERGARPDLPGRMRRRGGLGRRGRDHRRAEPARDRQSFQGHADAAPAAGEAGAAAERRARPQRRQGPGKRQARARNRRRRRAQPADDRPARRRQVDAGGATARHIAAARTGRGAAGRDDPIGSRRAARRRAVARAAVPRSASFRLVAGIGRRRVEGAARRDLAGP